MLENVAFGRWLLMGAFTKEINALIEEAWDRFLAPSTTAGQRELSSRATQACPELSHADTLILDF